jgi:hypothetical protein
MGLDAIGVVEQVGDGCSRGSTGFLEQVEDSSQNRRVYSLSSPHSNLRNWN